MNNDIAAYPDHRFRNDLRILLADPQFISCLESLHGIFHKGMESSVQTWKKSLGAIKNAVDFHRLMTSLVRVVVERTTRGLSVSGLNLPCFREQNQGICLLSNHRSTSLDPALVNYLLTAHLGRHAYNAAGDNIFKTPWLGHLIRMNRGFIVRREVPDMDDKMAEIQKLSEYINSLLEQQEWVWIAHRNGRSKDGTDLTDSAVLAMLKKSRPQLDWSGYTRTRALVPVAISWELIPLDLDLARDQAGTSSNTGAYRDKLNIFSEILQEKGRVHVAFCPPVTDDKRSALVEGIDSSIHGNIQLFEANYLAWSWSQACSPEDRSVLESAMDLDKGRWILDRRAGLSEAESAHFLAMYAAPVRNAVDRYGQIRNVLEKQKSLAASALPGLV